MEWLQNFVQITRTEKRRRKLRPHADVRPYTLDVRRRGSNSFLDFQVSDGIVSPPHGGPPVPTLVVQVTAVPCDPYVCGDT